MAAALVLSPMADLRRARLDAGCLRARPDLAVLVNCSGAGACAHLITHDLSLAWSLCDRIAVMYLGTVVEQGSAVDVIERPQHPYTQALVNAVPVPSRAGAEGRSGDRGSYPDATDVPSGCRFHPRCAKRFEPCDRVDPPLLRAGGAEQHAACLFARPALAKEADAVVG